MDTIRQENQAPNTGEPPIRDGAANPRKVECAASLVAGSLLIARGLQKKGWRGTVMALVGGTFVYRGINAYKSRKKSPNTSVPHRTGTRIEDAITINRPREEVYRFARDLANIAQFAEHIHSVHTVGNGDRSHWTAKGSGEKRIELNTQIINEKENERVAWRSLDGSDVANAGSVLFKDAAGGRGTEVHVEILYTPPGGKLGAWVTKVSGQDPADQVRRDLKRLKAQLEAGVLPETEGQPAGNHAGSRQAAHQRNVKSDAVAKASEASFPASDAPAYTH